jgi:hypothetical protein
VETTNYRVAARLVEMKLEDDHDIHPVIAVPSAPSAIIAACGQPSSSHFTDISGRATVTGVGFFDIPHGQTGVAPNAIELHPVLKFLASSCSH